MDFKIDRKWAIPSAVGVVSFGVGAAAGYIFCAHRVRSTLAQMEHVLESMDEVVAQAQLDLYTLQEEKEKTVPFVDPNQTVLEPITQANEVGDSTNVIFGTVDLGHSRRQVFPDPTAASVESSDWDYEVERRARELHPFKPYVIHRDEYEDNEDDYSQSTLTYYEGDDVLVDEHDVPIYDPGNVIGSLEWGKGSSDINVFFVRNDRLKAEYEILRDHGHYAVEVLGVQIEEEFEERDRNGRKPQKFRDD